MSHSIHIIFPSNIELDLTSGTLKYVAILRCRDPFSGSCWRFLGIPSGKLTWEWKIHLLKMYSLLNMGIFHCYVSLPEGSGFISIYTSHDNQPNVIVMGLSNSFVAIIRRTEQRSKHWKDVSLYRLVHRDSF